jgi:hypothetical protein
MERISPNTAGLTQRIYEDSKIYRVYKGKKDEKYTILKRHELMSCGHNQY